MNLRQLRHVVALADERNFARAAERISLSQPALSRSIKAFEDAHGVKIFDRDRTGTRLTSPGEELVRKARILIESADDLSRTLADESTGDTGSVFLGVAPLPANILLERLFSRVITRHPSMEIHAEVQANPMLLGALYDGHLDFIIGAASSLTRDSALHAERILTVPFDLIVRAGHPIFAEAEVTLDELQRYPFAGAHTGQLGRRREFIGQTPFTSLRRLSVSCDNYDLLKSLTQNTDIVWLTSALCAEEELNSGILTFLPAPNLQLPKNIDISIFNLKGRSLSRAAMRVLDEARNICAEIAAT